MATKYKTLVNVSDAQLEQYDAAGWHIYHMEFQPIPGKITAGRADFALCVVFMREEETETTPPPDETPTAAAVGTADNPIDRAIEAALGAFEETVIDVEPGYPPPPPSTPLQNATILGLPDSPADDEPTRMPGARQQLADRLAEFDIPDDVDMWSITLEQCRNRFTTRPNYMAIYKWVIDRRAYDIMSTPIRSCQTFTAVDPSRPFQVNF